MVKKIKDWIVEFYSSVGVEPLYPQVCQKVPVMTVLKEEQGPSPIELSRILNTVACSLSVRREDPIAIYYLVMEVNICDCNFVKDLKLQLFTH